LVSLSWCIRQGTRGEGDGDADYLPPCDVILILVLTITFTSYRKRYVNELLTITDPLQRGQWAGALFS